MTPLAGRLFLNTWVAAILLLCLLCGCAMQKMLPVAGDGRLVASQDYPDFLIVTPGPDDTFASLAQKYMHDPDGAWLIAAFNNLDTLQTNQDVLIPLAPVRPGGVTASGYQTVPVLTYHNFALSSTNKMTVTKALFEEQMRFLQENGYHVISMQNFIDFLAYQRQIPENSVLITIDDGWKSVYTIAFPILKRYGYPATLFVYTELIDGRGNHLAWEEIKEMAQHGITMQGHTLSHRYLNKRQAGETYQNYVQAITAELTQSARLIESHTGTKVDVLAYPYGATNHLVSAYTLKHGYRGAFTVNPKANPFFVNPYRINRTMILGDYDIRKFKACLNTFSAQTLQ